MKTYRMCGEEGERVDEDRGPDCGCELESVSCRKDGEGEGGRTSQMPAWAIIAVPVLQSTTHSHQALSIDG